MVKDEIGEFWELDLQECCWDETISVVEFDIEGLLGTLIMDVLTDHVLFFIGYEVEGLDIGVIGKPRRRGRPLTIRQYIWPDKKMIFSLSQTVILIKNRYHSGSQRFLSIITLRRRPYGNRYSAIQ